MESHIVILLLAFAIITECKNSNNVCKSFQDYYTKSINPNCWYDPDVTADASELILSHGYPLRIYKVVTKDYYILQVFRIPPKSRNAKGIVFLQHPVFGSCTNWIDLGNVSLAFLFADAGYDVWMGNFRGTIYSDTHVYLSKNSNKYWNHSFHELGLYDLPAQFELVREQTGYRDKLYYVSHSMSATTAFVYASLLPKHAAENIKLFICWAPVAYMKYLTSTAILAAPFANLILFLREAFHQMNFISHKGLGHKILILFCSEIPWTIELCSLLSQTVSGYSPDYEMPEKIPVKINQNIAGSSIKIFVHYAQIVNEGGKFQFYDYGITKNKYHYHSKRPPLYPVENIKVPMCFIYGGKDIVADEKDVVNFYNKLPIETRYCLKKIEQYNHVNFQYGRDIEQLLLNLTINTVKQFPLNKK